MIDEEQTWRFFGYISTDLGRQSRKPIMVICDNCGNQRISSNQQLSIARNVGEMCRVCGVKKSRRSLDGRMVQSEAAKKAYFDDPTIKQRQSESQRKRYSDDFTLLERKSYAMKRYFNDPEIRKKHSDVMKKVHRDLTIRLRISESLKKLHRDDPTIGERWSKIQLRRYGEMIDPGLEICLHHIAYDFTDPDALTVRITRRFHGSIHHPKGQPVTERGYSLID